MQIASPSSPHGTAKVWFLTGASSGFGRLLAEEFLRQGHKGIATARSIEKVADLEQQHPGGPAALGLAAPAVPAR